MHSTLEKCLQGISLLQSFLINFAISFPEGMCRLKVAKWASHFPSKPCVDDLASFFLECSGHLASIFLHFCQETWKSPI